MLSSYSFTKQVTCDAKGQEFCLGIDEAGRGPVLGPMVYSAGFCPLDKEKDLKKLGLDDSKKLSPEQRADYSAKMKKIEWFGYAVRVLTPEDISAGMLGRTKYNLNEMSHDTALNLIRTVLDDMKVNVTKVFVDTVGSPEKYAEKIKKHFPKLHVTVAKKADSLYPIVSAASVVAKVTRDDALENWEFKEAKFNEATKEFGSGYPGDPNTKAYLNENMDRIFGYTRLIRFSWQTTATLLEAKGVKVDWPNDDEEEEHENAKSKPKKQKTLDSFKKNPLVRSGKFKDLAMHHVRDFL